MEQRSNRPERQSRSPFPKLLSSLALTRLIAVAVLLTIATVTQAVTLGQVKVLSYLNQPLEAEIDIVGLEPGQHEDLRIRLANQDQFDRLGIAYTMFLADLKFDIVQNAGRWIVRVRSNGPVNEPFLDFPVQMSWPGGQMVRQYTLLLDPLTLTRPATVTRATTPAPTPRLQPQTAPPPSFGATYGPVQRGETLWPIAQKLKPSGVTTQQMAIALLRANPQAFIDNNVNRLRAGAILTIPPLGVIEQLDAAAANREFAEQTRQWRAPVATSPREVVAAPSSAAASPELADEPTAAAPETDIPAADAASSADQADDQLRIVSKEEAAETSEDAAIQQQLMVTMEEIESNRITTTAIESRLAKLEEELSKMQALIELKDQQISALQSEIDARDAVGQAADATETEAPQATEPPETAAAEPPASLAPAEPKIVEPATEETTAIEPAVTIEAEPVPAPAPPAQLLYEQYKWFIWAVLGLIGLTAIGMVIRRNAAQSQNYVPMADLPSATPSSYAPAREPAREEIKQAERDFRDLSKTPAQPIEPETPSPEPLPQIKEDEIEAVESQLEDATNSLLDESLDGRLTTPSQKRDAPTEYDDDEIANWVEELGTEIEQLEISESPIEDTLRNSKRTEPESIDDDIPSLLNELDDQIETVSVDNKASASNIQLDPIEEPMQLDALKDTHPSAAEGSEPIEEDDTFKMSLELARAYLEIGDNGGARDMLKQALSGARNPDHRRQIEELLHQID